MFNTLESRTEELREHFNKELENVIKNQLEMKNIITVMKNMLEVINIRLINTEEQISNFEDRVVEIIQSEQHNGKQIFFFF